MFTLDPEMMKKAFFTGEENARFTHKTAGCFKLFPFVGNNSAPIVSSCDLVVGEWLRLACAQKIELESMEETLRKLADSIDDLDDEGKEKLTQIARSVYWNDDETPSLKAESIKAMRYLPCENQAVMKTALYLYSALNDGEKIKDAVKRALENAANDDNVLEKAVFEAMEAKIETLIPNADYYVVHLAPRKIFMKDLQFILESPARTKEHLVDLLEFYYFFYTSQTSLMLSRFEDGDRDTIIPLYFSLDWERTNKEPEGYRSGWEKLFPAIEKQLSHAATLEMLNQNPTGEKYDYVALKKYLEETGRYEEVAAQIKDLVDRYRNAIKDCEVMQELKKNENLDPVFSKVHFLFDNVLTQFRCSVRHRVNDAYTNHFKTFCQERFLKFRGPCGLMLNITEERLVFLTKLVVNNQEKLSLKEVFHELELRGVFLDQPSKDEVVLFYSKLNLIEKKSDSGDAQYVRKIL